MGIAENCLSRADIGEIREFILYGTERSTPEDNSYEKRLKEVWKPIDVWLSTVCPEANAREAAEVMLYAYAGAVEEIYTEIGLRAGIRLMSKKQS